MAYINSDVYKNGVLAEILQKRVFIALLYNDDNTGNYKIAAFSEVRQGPGTEVDNSETPNPEENLNQFGEYRNSSIDVNKISYSRTAACVDETKTVADFAIIALDDNASLSETSAYDGSRFKCPDLTKLEGVSITNNVLSGDTDLKLLVVGKLSTAVSINAASNFMFAGAQISFSAEDTTV